MKTSAADAIDAVLEVLNELLQSSYDEDAELRAVHEQKEEFYANQIADLTSIMNTNRAIYDSAIAHREYVEAEIEDTENFLDWIANRYVEIEDLIEALQDERCEASLIFVTRIREHFEAMDAIALLKQDLIAWDNAGMPTLAEIKALPSYSKLQAYTHMFKASALKSFLSLTQDDDDYMDVERRELGDDHEDNTREELVLDDAPDDDRYAE